MVDVQKVGDKNTQETAQQSHVEKMYQDVHKWLATNDYTNLSRGQSITGLPEVKFTHGDETFTIDTRKDGKEEIVRASGKNRDEIGMDLNQKERGVFNNKGRASESYTYQDQSNHDHTTNIEAYDETSGKLTRSERIAYSGAGYTDVSTRYNADGSVKSQDRISRDADGSLTTASGMKLNRDGSVNLQALADRQLDRINEQIQEIFGHKK